MVVANLSRVDGESILPRRHKLPPSLQEIYELPGRHVLRGTGAEAFPRTESRDNCVDEFLSCSIAVTLHHPEHFMSVYHTPFSMVIAAKLLNSYPNTGNSDELSRVFNFIYSFAGPEALPVVDWRHAEMLCAIAAEVRRRVEIHCFRYLGEREPLAVQVFAKNGNGIAVDKVDHALPRIPAEGRNGLFANPCPHRDRKGARRERSSCGATLPHPARCHHHSEIHAQGAYDREFQHL